MNEIRLRNKQTAHFVKYARDQLGMTQQQLADTLGTPRYNVAKWESGFTTPPGALVLKILQMMPREE